MKVELVFVVNGEEVRLDVPLNQPLHVAVRHALHNSGNTGRPDEDWELRDGNGMLIADLSQKVESYGFAPNTRLYLSLRVGAGG